MFVQPMLLAAGAMLAIAVSVEATLPPRTTSSTVSGSATDCQARQWVNDNLDQMPTTYERFAAYPIRFRNMFYERLPIETRVDFWQKHLTNFVAAHDLSPEQRALVADIRENIAGLLSTTSPEMNDGVYAEATRVLGKQLAKEALMNLVPVNSAEMVGEACSCSTVHGGCPGNYGCGVDGDSCDAVACGWFGLDTCNGECLSVDEQ